MRSGISDLKDEKNSMRSSDEDTTNILNDFFAAVFTRGRDSVTCRGDRGKMIHFF